MVYNVQTGALRRVGYELPKETKITPETDFAALTTTFSKIVSGGEFDSPHATAKILDSSGWLATPSYPYEGPRSDVVPIGSDIKDDPVVRFFYNNAARQIKAALEANADVNALDVVMKKISGAVEKRGNLLFLRGLSLLSGDLVIQDPDVEIRYELTDDQKVVSLALYRKGSLEEIEVSLPPSLVPPDSATALLAYQKQELASQKEQLAEARQALDTGRAIFKSDSPTIGIGVNPKKADAGFTVGIVAPKSPAARAGVEAGWTILEVNGKSSSQITFKEFMSIVLKTKEPIKFLFLDTQNKPQELVIAKELMP